MAWLRGSRHVQGFCKLNSLASSSFLADPFHQQSLPSASLLENALRVHIRSYDGATLSEKLPNFVRRHSRRSIIGPNTLEGAIADKATHEGEFAGVAVLNETRGERSIVKSSLTEVETNKSTHFDKFADSGRGLDINRGSIILKTDTVSEENASDPAINGTNNIKVAKQNGLLAYGFGNREVLTTLDCSVNGKSVGDRSQVETNLQKELEESKDKFNEELPAKNIPRNLPEESPSEAIYLRKRVGKIPGEIEGHGRILEKIRSLGTLPQKHENETSSEMHDLDHERQIGSEEEFAVHEHLGSLKGSHSQVDETEQKKRPSLSADLQPPRHRMHVKFLNSTATNDDLLQAFADCGEIVKAQAVKPTKQNTRFTYGFVEFKTSEGLSRALRKNTKIKGFKVEVEPSPLHTSDGISNWNLDFSMLKKLGPASTSSSHSASILSMLKSSSTEKVNNSADNFDISKVISLMRATRATKPEDLKKVAESEQTVVKYSQNAYVVGIQDLPTAVDLHQVQQALSVFGEIARSYMTKGECGSSYACIEFMSEEAKENALALHWIYIDGLQLRISRIDSPMTAVIRISNIHRDTAKSEILSECMACGQVARIEPRIQGVVDVYFETSELKNVNTILDRLNEIVLDHNRWMANPAPLYENGAAHDDQFIRSQKDKLFKDIQKLLQHINMYFEDLNRLNKLDEI